MNVNPVKLKKIIQKSSFNYRLAGARVTFTPDSISSKMISQDHSYASIINVPNDVLTEMGEKEFIELNFDLKNKAFPKLVFHQLEAEDCIAVINNNNFDISDGEQEIRFTQSGFNLDQIVLNDQLPDFTATLETIVTIDQEFIENALKYCDAAKKSKEKEIYFVVRDGNPHLGIAKDYKVAEATVEINGSISRNIRKEIWMPFRIIDFRAIINLIKSEDNAYQLNFTYDKSLDSGFALITSDDETEQYIIYSQRLKQTDELIGVRQQRYEEPPEIPESWNYAESVNKVNKITHKWKNLTHEFFNELWIAREILSKSPSEAARIMHGTLVPHMTWTQYCVDISSSRQVVNRWLKRAFEIEDDHDSEPIQIEHIVEGEDETESLNRFDNISDDYLNSIRNVVEDADEKIIDAFDGRKAGEQIQTLIEEIKTDSSKEAIVYVNNKYTYRDWFTPLYDGVLCFTNGNKNPGCFVYFGQNREKFVSEFSKHGVVLAKVL